MILSMSIKKPSCGLSDIFIGVPKTPLLIVGLFMQASLAFAGTGNSRELTLIHTADIHCEIQDRKELPGWLTLGRMIRQEMERNGGREKCLLIDCGDTFQGSYIGAFSRGRAAVLMLNSLNYDCWIPGNHDFDFGVARLSELISELNPRIIAANMPVLPGLDDGKIKKWCMFMKNGMKIAVIGLTLPSSPEITVPFRAPDMMASIDLIIPEIMDARPQLIILAAHHGLNRPAGVQDKSGILEIARKYPQIDIVLGGHTHVANPGEKIGWSSWYVQTPPYAESAVKLSISMNTGTGRIDSISSELMIPRAGSGYDVKSHEALAELVHESEKDSAKFVTTLEFPLMPADGIGSVNCALSENFCRAAIEATGADAAFFGAVNSFSLPAGKITRSDIFKLIPYENKIWTIQLSPCEIREVFHEQMGLEDKTRMLSAYGVSLQSLSGDAMNETVTDAQGRKIPEDSRISVCFGSYSACGAGGQFPCLRSIFRKQEYKPENTGILVRDALEKHLGRLKNKSPELQ